MANHITSSFQTVVLLEEYNQILENSDNRDSNSGVVKLLEKKTITKENTQIQIAVVEINREATETEWRDFKKSFLYHTNNFEGPNNLNEILENISNPNYLTVTVHTDDNSQGIKTALERWVLKEDENSFTLELPNDKHRLNTKELEAIDTFITVTPEAPTPEAPAPDAPAPKPTPDPHFLVKSTLVKYFQALDEKDQAAIARQSANKMYQGNLGGIIGAAQEFIGGNSFTELFTFPSLNDLAMESAMASEPWSGERAGYNVAAGLASALNLVGGVGGMIMDICLLPPALLAQSAYLLTTDADVDDLKVDPDRDFSWNNFDPNQVWCFDGVHGLYSFVKSIITTVGYVPYKAWVADGSENYDLFSRRASLDFQNEFFGLLGVNKDAPLDIKITTGAVNAIGVFTIAKGKGGRVAAVRSKASAGIGLMGRVPGSVPWIAKHPWIKSKLDAYNAAKTPPPATTSAKVVTELLRLGKKELKDSKELLDKPHTVRELDIAIRRVQNLIADYNKNSGIPNIEKAHLEARLLELVLQKHLQH